MEKGQLKLIRQSYKNKKVFITGHTGYKGSWLTLWIEKLGGKVKGYALKPSTTPSLFDFLSGKLKCESVIADIRDGGKLRKEILAFQPDFIFHMAAQPLVIESYNHPVETFEVNTLGTAHLLDAIRPLKKACSIVIVTTDKVYHNNEWPYPYRENEIIGGYDPYSASKAATEIVAASFRSSFFNPGNSSTHKKGIATARAGNVIGGGDYAKDRIMPDIFRALSEGKKIKVRQPLAVRPWQHVLEPLSGYLCLGARLHKSPAMFSTAFNFGPNFMDALPVEELVKQAIEVWGKGTFVIVNPSNVPHEAGVLKLDISKAANELKWEPLWTASTAIERTVHWYKQSLDKKADIYKLCVDDIESYENK